MAWLVHESEPDQHLFYTVYGYAVLDVWYPFAAQFYYANRLFPKAAVRGTADGPDIADRAVCIYRKLNNHCSHNIFADGLVRIA